MDYKLLLSGVYLYCYIFPVELDTVPKYNPRDVCGRTIFMPDGRSAVISLEFEGQECSPCEITVQPQTTTGRIVASLHDSWWSSNSPSVRTIDDGDEHDLFLNAHIFKDYIAKLKVMCRSGGTSRAHSSVTLTEIQPSSSPYEDFPVKCPGTPERYYLCREYYCVPRKVLCNGVSDCLDEGGTDIGKDESDFLCGTVPVTTTAPTPNRSRNNTFVIIGGVFAGVVAILLVACHCTSRRRGRRLKANNPPLSRVQPYTIQAYDGAQSVNNNIQLGLRQTVPSLQLSTHAPQPPTTTMPSTAGLPPATGLPPTTRLPSTTGLPSTAGLQPISSPWADPPPQYDTLFPEKPT